MTVPEDIRVDLCIIGAGSGGLSVAAMASQLGARCVLIERARMGGDCLNAGCIPSKALLAAAKAAANLRRAGRFGLAPLGMTVDYPAVLDHVRDVIAGIAPNDSVERFTGLGVRVIQAAGRFAGPDLVEAGDCRIRARRFVIATGSRPVIPDIPGLASVPYLTNETVFAQQALPRHLIVIGGGPVGIEMAQAHRRLGADVTVVEAGRILGRDDPELADLLRRSLEAEGIVIRDRTRIAGIEADPLGVALRLAGEQGDERLRGSAILVAAGGSPTSQGLGLKRRVLPPPPTGSRSMPVFAARTAGSMSLAMRRAAPSSPTWLATRPASSSATRCSASRPVPTERPFPASPTPSPSLPASA
ncbi:MAG: FAD-dependent oxidoreductase [Alphaproteobacteria bacterium]